jgi:hypothetical protein
MKLLALELELELSLLQSGAGIADRRPRAPVPQHDGAAAVLALGNRALEVAVADRMILDLHREPLDGRIGHGTLGHRPRLEHAVELEAEVVVEVRRGVLLHDERERFVGGAVTRAAGRLRSAGEVPHAAILLESHAGTRAQVRY